MFLGKKSLLTHCLLDDDVAVFRVSSAVEALHVDGIVSVWLQVSEQVVPYPCPKQRLLFILCLCVIRLIEDVETFNKWAIHWHILHKFHMQMTRSQSAEHSTKTSYLCVLHIVCTTQSIPYYFRSSTKEAAIQKCALLSNHNVSL